MRPSLLLATLILAMIHCATAAPLQFDGGEGELTLSEVTSHTMRIEWRPLQQPEKTGTSSAVLIPFPIYGKLLMRELSTLKDIPVGQFRISLTPEPPTLVVRRHDGNLLQEIKFGTNDISFRTAAPAFGLGEGAQQFDRRGAFYPMEPAWGGWNRPVLGSVVPSPFIIGSDGWAIFAHLPRGGRFDLRNGSGSFLQPTNVTRRSRWISF